MKKLLILLTLAVLATNCTHGVTTKRTIKTDGTVVKSIAGTVTSIERGDDGAVIELKQTNPDRTVVAIVSNGKMVVPFDASRIAKGDRIKVRGIRTHVKEQVQILAQQVYSFNPMRFASKTATAKEKAACEKAGGKVQPIGMAQSHACIYQLGDAGQGCGDDEECLGQCVLPKDKPEPKHGTPAVGSCSATNNIFGCKSLVKNGKFDGTLCVD